MIGIVSAYDTYLTVKLQESLDIYETNPLGRWLIAIDDGSVALFVGIKFVGTVIVLGTIPLLYWKRRSFGLAVVSGVACCQIVLFGYLTIG